jgi:hypothetical protein
VGNVVKNVNGNAPIATAGATTATAVDNKTTITVNNGNSSKNISENTGVNNNVNNASKNTATTQGEQQKISQ